VLIHAGKSRSDLAALADPELEKKVHALGGTMPTPAELPFGGVVGVAEMVDCVAKADLDTDDPFAVGPWCWVLSNARAFAKPVPFPGNLGWFEVPDELVAEALATAAVPPTVVRVQADTLVWPPQCACCGGAAEAPLPLTAAGLAAPYCVRCLGHLPVGKPLHAIRLDDPHPVATYSRQVLPGDQWEASADCATLGPAVRVEEVGGGAMTLRFANAAYAAAFARVNRLKP
jgi:hypothetical protein